MNPTKKGLKIPKGLSEAMNRATDKNNGRKKKGHTMMYKTLHRKTTHERTSPLTSGEFVCSGRVSSSSINGLGTIGIKCFIYIVMVIFIGMENKMEYM